MKDSTVSVRIDRELKEQAESIFKELGISVSSAFTLFYKQVVLNNGIPFDVTLPKKPKTLDEYTKEELDQMLEESFQQIEKGEFHSAEEVFARLKEGLNSEKIQNTGDKKSGASANGAA